MSKNFGDTGFLQVIKREELYKEKGTGLCVRGKRHIAVSCVSTVTECGVKDTSVYAAIRMCKSSVLVMLYED